MITNILASICFSGESFSPEEAEKITGLEFSEKNEVGDIGLRGRYKGSPLPYGSGLIKAPDSVEMHERILWLAKTLDGLIGVMRNCGSDEPHMYIGYFYQNQCNLSLTKEELNAITKLGIEFCFSCYGGDNE